MDGKSRRYAMVPACGMSFFPRILVLGNTSTWEDVHGRIAIRSVVMFTDESRPMGDFIPAETLVQNGTAGDHGTAGGTLTQPVLGFLVG